MNANTLPFTGAALVETSLVFDARGAFARFFCERELAPFLADQHITQINWSKTRNRGAVRGLHFQYPPHAETKLVRCIRGRVWDVLVDVRAGSPTFLQWHAEELSGEDARMLIIPEGCAHGFQVLEPESELLYLHTAFYAPASEGGLCPTDPAVGIAWPLPISDMSDRDRNHRLVDSDFVGVTL